MFDGGTIEVRDAAMVDDSWQELHRRLKTNHQQRARLDAREIALLLEAEEARLYRRLGQPSMVAYMMAELDCSRHTANEKLRVAHALIDLPTIDQEFQRGVLSWTKVRELTRVATCETEEEWLDAVGGKDAAQVQQMVKGFAKGARPTDRPDPDLVTEWVGLELSPQMAALWRQMRVALDDEAGRHLSDLELAEQVCKRALMPAVPEGVAPKPAFQIAHKTCPECARTQQVGPGVEIEVTRGQAERAMCDAVLIGDLDDDEPTPLRSTIPYATRRKVLVRDRYACTVPGCTSRRFLEIHHTEPQAAGGGHELPNLTTLCDGHHALHHDGVLAISGVAPDALVFETVPRGLPEDG